MPRMLQKGKISRDVYCGPPSGEAHAAEIHAQTSAEEFSGIGARIIVGVSLGVDLVPLRGCNSIPLLPAMSARSWSLSRVGVTRPAGHAFPASTLSTCTCRRHCVPGTPMAS